MTVFFGAFSVNIITVLLALCLVWSEVTYFVNPAHKFSFIPDTDFEAKLQINVDMTIAMPCDCKQTLFMLAHDLHEILSSVSTLFVRKN